MIHDFYSIKELWRQFPDEFATELKSVVKLRDTASSRRELSLDQLEYIQKRLQTLQPHGRVCGGKGQRGFGYQKIMGGLERRLAI